MDGILRSEVWLVKTKAVRAYVDEEDIFRQIINLCEKYQDVFLETFVKIIPFGDFYKKVRQKKLFGGRLRMID